MEQVVEYGTGGSEERLVSGAVTQVSPGHLVDKPHIQGILRADPLYLEKLFARRGKHLGKASETFYGLSGGAFHVFPGSSECEEKFHNFFIGKPFKTALLKSSPQPFPVTLTFFLPFVLFHVQPRSDLGFRRSCPNCTRGLALS